MARQRIWNWNAKRSGAAITITGVNAQSRPITISVTSIDASPGAAPPTAQDKDGQFYELA